MFLSKSCSNYELCRLYFQEDRQALHNCLVTLRLLGKFLGYVTFLPYLSPDILPSSICDSYLTMRNRVRQCGNWRKLLISSLLANSCHNSLGCPAHFCQSKLYFYISRPCNGPINDAKKSVTLLFTQLDHMEPTHLSLR